MRTDTARTIATIAIWATVAVVLGMLTTMKFNGPEFMIVSVFVGMTAFLSIGAAIGTAAIWRSPCPALPPKDIHREV
jgi:hypothetical protein